MMIFLTLNSLRGQHNHIFFHWTTWQSKYKGSQWHEGMLETNLGFGIENALQDAMQYMAKHGV